MGVSVCLCVGRGEGEGTGRQRKTQKPNTERTLTSETGGMRDCERTGGGGNKKSRRQEIGETGDRYRMAVARQGQPESRKVDSSPWSYGVLF